MRQQLGHRAYCAAATALALSQGAPRDKLPIYPAPDEPIVIVEEPSELERQIGGIRRTATSAYRDAHANVQDVVSKWIGVEHAVEKRVKSLVDPTEEVTPGLLYTTIATLTTSIITRNRGLPTRFLLPPTAFLVSFSYFLPKTSANVSAYVNELEERYVPGVAEKHATARAHSGMLAQRIQDQLAESRDGLGRQAGYGVDWVQGVTGLKIREALGWGEGVLEGAEQRTGRVTGEIERLLGNDRNLSGAETDKGLFANAFRGVVDEAKERAQIARAEAAKMAQTDRNLVSDAAKGVAGEAKERAQIGAEEASKMAETDRSLLGKAKEWVGDVISETGARTTAAKEEISKKLETDKQLAQKESEEMKEVTKKEVKRLV